MLLSDHEILERIDEYARFGMEEPLIVPFKSDRLQGASYDLQINEFVYRLRRSDTPIDLAFQKQIDALYDELDITDGYIIRPQEFILCTVDCIINLPEDLAAHVRERTRFIRMGLHTNFQHINPLSTTQLNVGLFNFSPNDIIIYPGTGVGQIVFESLTSVPSPDRQYKNKKDGVHYSEDISFVGSKTEDEFLERARSEYAEMKNLFDLEQ